MKLTSRITTLFVRALSESMSVDQMQRAARMVIPGYDIQARSGFPPNIPIPRGDAARHILRDFLDQGALLKLIQALIELTTQGDMGREVKIPLLPHILAEVEDQGYQYSQQKGLFVEGGKRERTMGWGTLTEGGNYEFALLRIDIAQNSELVRRYPRGLINAAYATVRDMVTRLVEKRDGRVWSWEGDGGLAAFYFSDKTIQATLCGMEIIHELFLYNLIGRTLPEPVRVRLAVHAGPCRFLRSSKESAGDTIRRVELLEASYTRPGCLTVSPGVFTDLGSKLSPLFTAVTGPDNSSVFRYGLEWEQK
jgi:class 3 adenylate cyclase